VPSESKEMRQLLEHRTSCHNDLEQQPKSAMFYISITDHQILRQHDLKILSLSNNVQTHYSGVTSEICSTDRKQMAIPAQNAFYMSTSKYVQKRHNLLFSHSKKQKNGSIIIVLREIMALHDCIAI